MSVCSGRELTLRALDFRSRKAFFAAVAVEPLALPGEYLPSRIDQEVVKGASEVTW